MNTFQKIGITLSFIFLVGCGGGGSDGPTTVATTTAPSNPTGTIYKNLAWENARVFKPYSSVPYSISELEKMPPLPVAITLHGCSGIDKNLVIQNFPVFLASLGYLVIEPNSYFDDPNGICQTGEYFQFRVDDAKYALAQVSQGKYYDKNRLVLHGQSQGGLILTYNYFEGPTHFLISGFSCAYGLTMYNAKFPKESKVMYIGATEDPNSNTVLECGKLGPNVQTVLLKGPYHNPLVSSDGMKAIYEFLKI